MPLTRIDSAFLDLDAIGGIDFDVNNNIPTFKVDATTHRVGIGTNNPDKKLVVRAADSEIVIDDTNGNPGLRFRNNGTTGGTIDVTSSNSLRFKAGGDTERLRITYDGDVGIGTETPTTKLEVIGDITVSNQNAFIELKDPDTADANYRLRNQGGSFSIYDVTNNQVKIATTAGGVTIYPNLNANNGLDVMGTITGDGNLDIADGIRHYGDTNTSISFPAADTITAETDGTERLRITDTGDVGIGTDNPGEKLDVRGKIRIEDDSPSPGLLIRDSDADGDIAIYQYNSGDLQIINNATSRNIVFQTHNGTSVGERLRITSDGNVGIGTNAPAQKLDVNGNIKSNNYLGKNTATGSLWLTVGTNTQNPSVALWARDHATYPGQAHILGRTSNASTIAGQIRFYTYDGSAWSIRGMWGKNGYLGIRNSNSDPEVPLHIQQGSALDRTAYLTKADDTNFRLTAANGSGTNSSGQETARFGMNYASTNSWGEYIKFVRGSGEANGSMGLYSSNTERIHIKADGNVGIGTNGPGAKLHIESAATTAGWQIRTDSVGLNNESGFYRDASDHYEMVLRNGFGGLSYIKNDGGASTANLRVNVQGGERLTILSDGNVGIGTNNPVYPLHVQESAYFRRGIQVAVLSSNELQSRSPINSGFYNVDNTTTADGWPFTGWAHLLANTHSNTTNYYSQQFASKFFDQELYFRNTNSGGTTTSQSWGQVMHTNSSLDPVYSESDGSTDSWSRYFYPGGEYYTAVHSGTGNDFNNFKEQGYYHVNNTASNAPASGYGYLEIHRHQGSQYFTQKFTLSGDTSQTFFRRGSDSNGTQVFGSWNTYGSLERENTFTNNQNFSNDNYLTFGPNSSWSRYLRVGGNGYQGNSTTASVACTNGNLHLDAASGAFASYLNWYAGTNGVYFGDGAGAQAARMYNTGVLLLGPRNTAQLQVHGNANQVLLKPDSGSKPTVIFRNDGSNYWTLITNSGTGVSNTWNTRRPFYFNLSTGKVGSNNGQEFSGGTKVFTSMNLANIELDFTTANHKYIDFYTNNGNTVNFRMPTSANVFHTGIQMTRNSAVSLYHANSVKLYTTSSGAYVNGTLGQSSDANLKENIVTVPNALDKVKAMRGVKFNWRKDGRADFGIIAQEAETVVPELVSNQEIKTLTQAGALKKRPDDSDYTTTTQKSFSYSSMVGVLLEAIKEQQATIDSLTARIDALENP